MKSIKKITVRSSIAIMFLILIVTGFQNCSIYHSDLRETGKRGQPTECEGNVDGDCVTDPTECNILNLNKPGTVISTYPYYNFTWDISNEDCVVEAKINNRSWTTCSNSTNSTCKQIGDSYSFTINKFGTHTLKIQTSTNKISTTITLVKQTTNTIKPPNCDSYEECMAIIENKKYSIRNNCLCEPKTGSNAMCFEAVCDGILPLE